MQTYHVFPDANAVRALPDHSIFIQNGFQKELESIPAPYVVNVLIPESVAEEILHQKLVIATSNHGKITDALAKLAALSGKASKYPHSLETIKRHTTKRCYAEIKKRGYAVVPVLTIKPKQWHEIFRLAVQRIAPFEEGDTEKGFRDAVFCFSVLERRKKITSGTTVVISRDEKIIEFFSEHLKKDDSLRMFPDAAAFAGEIKLAAEKMTVAPAEFIKLAAESFFNSAAPTSYYYKWGIWAELESRIAKINLTFSGSSNVFRRMTATSDLPTIVIRPTNFVRVEQGRYRWFTAIDVKQKMQDILTGFGGRTSTSTLQPTRTYTFTVAWDAKVSKNALDDAKLIEIQQSLVEDQFTSSGELATKLLVGNVLTGTYYPPDLVSGAATSTTKDWFTDLLKNPNTSAVAGSLDWSALVPGNVSASSGAK